MNIFDLRQDIINDYQQYATSFLTIRDDYIRQRISKEQERGAFWPDPLIQLNPNFKPGAWIADLVQDDTLHRLCETIFAFNKGTSERRPLRLHQHQLDAVNVARGGHNYVLTTGTGSGKSLAYIVPIVDYVLRQGSGQGIKALIIYPMNALANSQEGELRKFLEEGFDTPPVTFARYTGQESLQRRKEIMADPPDILLTNYVMLELLLTRVHEQQLMHHAEGLRFLVLDELHTYRGRQGADVAMLVRRVRNRLNPDGQLQVIGTSATLASEGTLAQQREENANVASKIFGTPVHPEHVIGETLQRATKEPDIENPAYIAALTERVHQVAQSTITEAVADYETFVSDPLSRWLESAFGIAEDPLSGTLVRREPRPISGDNGAASELAERTGLSVRDCKTAIEIWLLRGYETAPNPQTGKPPFAFRLHQFLSPGDAVYTSLKPEDERYITVRGQRYRPGSDRSELLYPMVFCRECGQEFYTVRLHHPLDGVEAHLEPRDFRDGQDDEGTTIGYFYVDTDNPFPHELEAVLKRVPQDWLEDTASGGKRIKQNRRKYVPQHYNFAPSGESDAAGTHGVFLPEKFLFCPCCQVSYSARLGDFGKLATLSSEGRSSATTIISLSTILALRAIGDAGPHALPERARKLLSFTDNRQDASLQAGHFNDLVDIGLLRGALYRAVRDAGDEGLTHDILAERVFEALNLPYEDYAEKPEQSSFKPLVENTNSALRAVLGYRLYLDLRRGWRITSPNLEQTGLLKIDYRWLHEIAAHAEFWEHRHDALQTASQETRGHILRVLLDYMRRELAIHVLYLDQTTQERIKKNSNQRLNEEKRWAIDENERMVHSAILYPRSSQQGDYQGNVYLSSYGGFGQYLRRRTTFKTHPDTLKMVDTDAIIPQLLDILYQADVLRLADEPRNPDDVPGYQLKADVMVWKAGDGKSGFHDPIRVPQASDVGHVNPFFRRFYQDMATHLTGLRAREHTAQVPYKSRETREADFREGRLPVMYCSPTMELGVDIAELNVVNMRNVPPTPANYAQRSGRAGRSGQPALVVTYCSSGSPHDQYFFRRPQKMVSGQVAPPRIDLTNEELIRAHIHAIWLEEAHIDLKKSVSELLDVDGENPSLALSDDIYQAVNTRSPLDRTFQRATAMLQPLREKLQQTNWYNPEWLNNLITRIPESFDRTCNRWRDLYRAARQQYDKQTRIAVDQSRTQQDRRQARYLRDNAESQLNMLTTTDTFGQSDFYSYRYFATEGFLPGYSFPRLPVYAYIPGRRGSDSDDYLSRPRFLAISEFGPRALIYHEGSRYLINQVTLPVQQSSDSGDGNVTESMKYCQVCGYAHPVTGNKSYDICENCGAKLPVPLDDLLRLETVRTKRRDRISSDEEERLRIGYEIRTGLRYAETDTGTSQKRVASVQVGEQSFGVLTYGASATLWRINVGWRRRREKNKLGFVLDMERGYWKKNEQDLIDDEDDPLSPRTERVIPYVRDTGNVLLFELDDNLDTTQILSLQTALKQGIEAVYQLEDNELAAEVLPDIDTPHQLLFYEASEGGAGVLRDLLETPGALADVAVAALEICHYDAAKSYHDGDMGSAANAGERCEAACYDCLLSYRNQYVHGQLDRHEAAWYLYMLRDSVVQASSSAAPRSEHMQRLVNLCESDLEKEWLNYLNRHDLRLPSDAQVYSEGCQSRIDFFYQSDSNPAVIFIDGPHHDSASQQEKDADITQCFENKGYTVVRFSYHRDEWPALINEYAYIFGAKKE